MEVARSSIFSSTRGVLQRLVVTAALSCLPLVSAAQGGLLLQPYPYMVVEQDLRIVLREFGRNLGIGLDVSDKVKGVVRGMRGTDSAEAFLRRLAQAHDLVWYLDRNTLFVSTWDDNDTEVLTTPALEARERYALADQWSALGMGVAVEAHEQAPAIVVTGPASFRRRLAVLTGRAPAADLLADAGGEGAAGITIYRGKAGTRQVVVPR